MPVVAAFVIFAPLKPLFAALVVQLTVVMVYSCRLAHSGEVP